jgi:putative transposase
MTVIQRAFKTELALNNAQITACKKHAGAARWAYNWGLARKQEAYRATGKSPSAIELHRELNALKPRDVPWMYDVSKCAPQEALRNLDAAYAHFFGRRQLKQQGKYRGKAGYPTFKSKKHGLGSFRLTGSIVVFSDAIQLPRLGRLRLKERDYLPATAKVLSATVSEHAGHWYVSILVEQEHVAPENGGPVVGVDLGIKTLATLSDVRSNRTHGICARASRRSSDCSALSHASRKAAVTARRKSLDWQRFIAKWPISVLTRCINSPRCWRKPSQPW